MVKATTTEGIVEKAQICNNGGHKKHSNIYIHLPRTMHISITVSQFHNSDLYISDLRWPLIKHHVKACHIKCLNFNGQISLRYALGMTTPAYMQMVIIMVSYYHEPSNSPV